MYTKIDTAGRCRKSDGERERCRERDGEREMERERDLPHADVYGGP